MLCDAVTSLPIGSAWELENKMGPLIQPPSGDLAREMTGHEGPVFALDVSPNGTRVASGDAAGVALLWTLGAERPDSAWRAHDNTVSAVTFVGNDRTVATAGWDRRVLLLSEEDGAPVEIDRLPGPALSLDVGADGVTLAAGASTSGEASITFWHVPSRTRVLTLAGAPAQAIAFVEGAHAFTTGVASGDVRVWEARPETPAPIDPEDPRTTTLEWADASALYYEAQVTRTLPVGESDTTLLTRRTSIELPEEFVDGSHVWWRVRSVGFGAVTDWSEPHSIIADGPAASVAQVWVELSPRQAAVGDRVTARVMIDGAIGLAGFELDIVIDPGVLAPLEAAIGDALGDSSQTSWAEPTSTGENGAYALSGAKGARLGGGIHATGALVTVVLAAEKAGQAEVRVRNLSLSSAGAARIDASVASASAAILPAGLPADVTRDGVVDIVDLLSVATFFGRVADDDHMTRVDVDGSGAIDIADLALVARDFGMSIESVAAAGPRLGLNRPLSDVREWMARVGPGDHDMAAWRRLLAVLDAALADGAGGATTPLLAAASAYPNPSNPATWIPFALSRPAHVDVAIYDTRGLRVRSIRLGARDPGDHMRRGSAAYWDGRNDAGDRVSGGLYIARVTATPTAGGPARTEHARIVMSR